MEHSGAEGESLKTAEHEFPLTHEDRDFLEAMTGEEVTDESLADSSKSKGVFACTQCEYKTSWRKCVRMHIKKVRDSTRGSCKYLAIPSLL